MQWPFNTWNRHVYDRCLILHSWIGATMNWNVACQSYRRNFSWAWGFWLQYLNVRITTVLVSCIIIITVHCVELYLTPKYVIASCKACPFGLMYMCRMEGCARVAGFEAKICLECFFCFVAHLSFLVYTLLLAILCTNWILITNTCRYYTEHRTYTDLRGVDK
jgi:hypothetical protein